MAVVQKTVLLAFSAEQMFALVEKVEDYPAFLPWCGGVEVKQRSPEKLVATIAIAYHGIKQSFTTENQNTAPTHSNSYRRKTELYRNHPPNPKTLSLCAQFCALHDGVWTP